MKRNIQVLYIFRVLRTFALFTAVLLPFFDSYGISQTEFFLTQSTFAGTILVLEIPSGHVADRKGRKFSLTIGACAIAAGFWGYVLGDAIEIFMAAELLLGLGYSFVSGADEALAYDSYREQNQTDQYKVFETNSNGFMAVSEASASVAGGLLAIASLRAPFIGQAVISLITIPLCFALTEPPTLSPTKSSSDRLTIRTIVRMTLFEKRQLRWLVAYGAVVSTMTHTAVWLAQPYYRLVDIPLGWFGVVWAAQSITLGLFSQFVLRYERFLGFRKTLISLPIIGVSTYIILGAYPNIFVLPTILGFFFVRAVHMPLLRQAINDRVDSGYRATVLSVNNMVKQLLYAGLGPLVGVAVDAYSLQVGLLASAALYGVLSFGVIAFMGMLL